jgi:hypothetical protein
MALRPVADSKAILNHVLNLQRFSLASYLRFARPRAAESDRDLLSVVVGIAEAQGENTTRLGELLVERHASAKPGTFPMRFTGLNDVSVRHLAPHIIQELERSVHELRWCADALRDDATARDIVKLVLRDEQRHLLVLREKLDVARETEAPSQRPNGLTHSTPTMRDIYGEALNRWTNEGGAFASDGITVCSPWRAPQNGQKCDVEPSAPSALHA